MSKTTPATASETGFDLDLLEATYGPTARREFEHSLADEKPRLWQWAFEVLPVKFDDEFVRTASSAIYDSANMANYPGFENLHFKATVCYRESERRHALAHPDEDCRATSLYQRAFNMAVRDAGHSHMASEIVPCTCQPRDAAPSTTDNTMKG